MAAGNNQPLVLPPLGALVRIEALPIAAIIIVDFAKSLLTGLGIIHLSSDPTEPMAYGILYLASLGLMVLIGIAIAISKRRVRASLPLLALLVLFAPFGFKLSHTIEDRLIYASWWERHQCTPESLLNCAKALYQLEAHPLERFNHSTKIEFFRKKAPELKAFGLSPAGTLISGISILEPQSFELIQKEWKIQSLEPQEKLGLRAILEFYLCPAFRTSSHPEEFKAPFLPLLGDQSWPCPSAI